MVGELGLIILSLVHVLVGEKDQDFSGFLEVLFSDAAVLAVGEVPAGTWCRGFAAS